MASRTLGRLDAWNLSACPNRVSALEDVGWTDGESTQPGTLKHVMSSRLVTMRKEEDVRHLALSTAAE